MADFSANSTISITCPRGLPPFLQSELTKLGYRPVNIRSTGMEIQGSLNDCIRLNFWLRTAHRVHYLVNENRQVKDPESLYSWLTSLPWDQYVSPDGYVSVTSRIDHPSIDNTQYANLMVKDAIVDQIRTATGRRPDSGSNLNKTVIFLYWDRKTARIFLDTSGESLSRRGYRTESVQAPMQESLASAIIHATQWAPGWHFINPMSGSGTLAIETALIAQNRPPASLRHQFGFMHILGYDDSYYQDIRDEARKQTRKEISGKIIATDRDRISIKSCRKNARTAGVDHLIEFDLCNYDETPVPDGNGVVVLNPPYGERLDTTGKLKPLYRGIGDFLKNSCKNKMGYVFTGNFSLAKQIGLRTSQRIPLYNSTIECRLLEYEIY